MTKEKQFARAKAIAVLECMAIDLTGSLAGLKEANPMTEVLNQRLDAIDVAQEALREQPHWISVEERLPDEKGEYLTYDQWGYGAVIKTAYWTPKYDGFDEYLRGRSIWHNYDSEYGCYELTGITHWMPLPDAPEVEV